MNEDQKESMQKSKEARAIGVSLLFLILGFAVIWIIKVVLKIEGDAVYVSLLFVPILIYLIISGKLI